MHRRRRRIAAATLSAAAALLAISWLGVWFPIADNINIAALYWWPALLTGVGAATWALRHRNALWPGVCLIFLVLGTGVVLFRSLLHAAPPPATKTQRISLIEFNMLKSNTQAAADAAWLAEQDADIVVLLEATRMHGKWGAALRAKYPSMMSCSVRYPCSTVLFSKYPILRSEALARNGDAEDRKALSALTATLDVNGTPLTVFAVHLDRPWPLGEQERWVKPLAEVAAGIDGPAVLTGDFNSTPWTHAMRTISEAGNFRLGSGIGTSWPAQNAAAFRLPLDQLYLRGRVRATGTAIGPQRGSDHRPLIVELEIPAGA